MSRFLTDDEVQEIKRLLFEGHSQAKLAKATRVSPAHISRIFNGLAWRDIKWPNGNIGSFEDATGIVRNVRDRGFGSIDQPSNINQAQGFSKEAVDILSTALEIKTEENNTNGSDIKEDEQYAIEIAQKEAVTNKMLEMYAEVEAENEAKYKEGIKSTHDPSKQVEAPPPFTMWEALFMEWDEVKEKAPEHEMVKSVIADGDEVLERAVGIVFYNIPIEKWKEDEALRLIADTFKQLKASKKD